MVIPRLLIAQRLPQGASTAAERRRGRVLPTQAEVKRLADVCAQPNVVQALELTLDILGSGLSLETVLLYLIGPAARSLGTDWEEDVRSFADVTVGLGTLHEVVHCLTYRDDEARVAQRDPKPDDARQPKSPHQGNTQTARGSALLLSGPGEQHTLGLYIFAQLLRHSRWAVLVEAAMPSDALLQCVRSRKVDVVGISVSSPERLAEMAELAQTITRAAQNPALRVLFGGPVDLKQEAERAGLRFFDDARAAVASLDADKSLE
jgi:methanogenic corrinoid protein MtbC1